MSKGSEATATLLPGAQYDRSYYPQYPQYPQYQQRHASYPQYAGGYHQREGLATSPTHTQSKSKGFYLPNSKWTWAFTGIAITQAVVGLALESIIFAKFQLGLSNDADRLGSSSGAGPEGHSQAKSIPTYLSLFIFGFLYQLWLVYDALRMKNTIQVIGLCLYNLGLLIEAAVQSDQIHDAYNALVSEGHLINLAFWGYAHPLLIALPCVIGLGTLLLSLVAWKLYDEFAWSIYKHISADLRLKRRYLSYQIYIALLKFDFFFFLCFSVQFLVVVEDTTSAEFYLTIAAIPITIVLLFLAAYWTRKESLVGMIFTIIIYFAALAYFIFKLIRMYAGPPDRVADYLPARRSLTTFAVLTLLCLLATLVYAFICLFNFNKGLKQHITSEATRSRSGSNALDKMYTHEVPLAGPGPSRMTID